MRVNAEGTSSNLDAILGITAEKEEEEEVVVEAKTEEVAAPDVESNAVPDVAPISATEGYAKLAAELDAISQLPPSERGEAAENATGTVRAVLNGMKAAGETNRWDCYPELTRKNVFPNELNQVGVKNSDQIGAPNNTNDFNFIVVVVNFIGRSGPLAPEALYNKSSCSAIYILRDRRQHAHLEHQMLHDLRTGLLQ